ncbi:MAG: hypothetical protein DMD67_02240 [Gemmatimonadetes bacterium]|nr:MAG: hypothetical protein DMD67_02240 [Gemmatimonadota bacterium]
MGDARCDFYDWTAHRSCNEPARWVTHQSSVGTRRERHYCDAHRPPRAHPMITLPATETGAPPAEPKPPKGR